MESGSMVRVEASDIKSDYGDSDLSHDRPKDAATFYSPAFAHCDRRISFRIVIKFEGSSGPWTPSLQSICDISKPFHSRLIFDFSGSKHRWTSEWSLAANSCASGDLLGYQYVGYFLNGRKNGSRQLDPFGTKDLVSVLVSVDTCEFGGVERVLPIPARYNLDLLKEILDGKQVDLWEREVYACDQPEKKFYVHLLPFLCMEKFAQKLLGTSNLGEKMVETGSSNGPISQEEESETINGEIAEPQKDLNQNEPKLANGHSGLKSKQDLVEGNRPVNSTVVEISDLSADVLTEIVTFAYSGNVLREFEPNVARGLIEAWRSDKYGYLDGLKMLFAKLEQLLSAETCMQILLLADEFGQRVLKQKAMDFFKNSVDDVTKSEHFVKLEGKTMLLKELFRNF